MTKEEIKPEAKPEVQPSVIQRNQPVIRFSDGKPAIQDFNPNKERYSDGKPISGSGDVQDARTYAKYTDIVHGVGQAALTPFIGETGAKGVRGVFEGLEGLITKSAEKNRA